MRPQCDLHCYFELVRDAPKAPFSRMLPGRRPSEYVKDHAYWRVFDDPIGVRLRHQVGVDHIVLGSDFPHEVSRWPNSMEVMGEQLAGVPEDEQRKTLCENAIEYFHLDR